MPGKEDSVSIWRAAAILGVLIGVAFGSSLRNEYVFDDLMFVQDDPRVRDLAESPRLFVEPLWGYTGSDGQARLHQYYRPLQTFPLALSYAIAGDVAWPAHLLNLLLHWANTLMVFAIVDRLVGRRGAALAVAMLFAVHPANSEAVLWVSNVAGLGAAACIFAVVLLHMAGRGADALGWLLTAGLTLVGLGFKESGILAPVYILVHDLLGSRPSPRATRMGDPVAPIAHDTDSASNSQPATGNRQLATTLWRYSAFVPALAVYYWLRQGALGGVLPGFDRVPLTRWDLILNAVGLVPQYVRTFLWPFDLNMYHDFDAVHGIADPRVVIGAAVLAGAAWIAVRQWRRSPAVALGIAWAVAGAAPHLLVRWPELNVYAERYLYLPIFGIGLAAAAWASSRRVPAAEAHFSPLSQLGAAGDANIQDSPFPDAHGAARATATRHGGYAWGALALLLAIFVAVDIRRTADWRDDVTLYSTVLAQSPRAALIRNNLAVKYLALGRYDEGIDLLTNLLEREPEWRDAWYNLGLLYLRKNRDADAIAALERAKRLAPLHSATALNLGYLYDRNQRRDEALSEYFRAVTLNDRDSQAWYNLAVIAAEERQFANARAAAARVLELHPTDTAAAAIVHNASRRTGIEADPAATQRRCADAKRLSDEGRVDDAVLALRAAAWRDERSPLPHRYLANLYYLGGRLRLAAESQREAVARAPDDPVLRRNLEALEASLAR